MSVFSLDTVQRSAYALQQWSLDDAQIGDTLDLSESRTYDCALEIRKAYKLTGNFSVDLQIVLEDLGLLNRVTFEIKPKSLSSDCRQVEFQPKRHVDNDQFEEIMRSIKSRIGSDPTPGLWARLFR
jgi:hypothetical protein